MAVTDSDQPQQQPTPAVQKIIKGAAAGQAVQVAGRAGAAPALSVVVPPATAAAVPIEVGATMTKYAVLIAIVRRLFAKHHAESADWLTTQLTQRFPGADPLVIRQAVERELEFERAFQQKALKRTEASFNAAAALPTPDKQAARIREIFNREKHYAGLREQALMNRAVSHIQNAIVKDRSPGGAVWMLGPRKTHTAGCVAMAGKPWPWDVLDIIPPPVHTGCGCWLRPLAPGETPPPPGEAMGMARAAMALEECYQAHPGLRELREARYEERLHPRGRGGRWIQILGKLKAAKMDEITEVEGHSVIRTKDGFSVRVGTDRAESADPEHIADAIQGHLDHIATLGEPVTLANMDQKWKQWGFTPDPLEGGKRIHPKSGFEVKTGKWLSTLEPDTEGVEGPPLYSVTDYGDGTGFAKYHAGTEPIRRVYRGMAVEEYKQALDRGYYRSDQRGTIADWEGTNAATDPRSAQSYLPRDHDAVIVQFDVKPEDNWFTIKNDDYVRTREQIPVDRVSAVSPVLHKDTEEGLFIRQPTQYVSTAVAKAAEAGGGTLDPRVGTEVKSGIAVALEGHSSITKDAEWNASDEQAAEIFKRWLKENAGLFNDPNVKVGVWHDTEHGEVVLDPSEIVQDREEAIRLGRERNQIAVYDIGAGEEIPTGGSGGRPEEAALDDRAEEAGLGDDRRGAGRAGPARGGPDEDAAAEAEELEEFRWEEALHPRGRGGRWVEALHHAGQEIEREQTAVHQGFTGEDFARQMDGFEHGGIRATLSPRTETQNLYGQIRLDLRRAGVREPVGFARITLKPPNSRGERVADFANMHLKRDEQNKGFGRAFTDHLFDTLRRGGVDKIQVEAVGTGSYAWARRGFVWQGDKKAAQQRILAAAKSDKRWDEIVEYSRGSSADLERKIAAGEFTSEAELAAWGIDNRWRLPSGRWTWTGKELMLGSSWKGELDLSASAHGPSTDEVGAAMARARTETQRVREPEPERVPTPAPALRLGRVEPERWQTLPEPSKGYEEEANEENAISHAWQHFGKLTKLPDDEKQALVNYSGDDGTTMNGMLRRDEIPTTGRAGRQIAALDRAMAHFTVQKPMVLYRGMGHHLPDQLAPGTTFRDKGFNSTSVFSWMGEEYAKDGGILEIQVPTGTHGVPLSPYGPEFKNEGEVLLPRGTTYRVIGTETRGGVKHVIVEIV